jgi:hypothetical protein
MGFEVITAVAMNATVIRDIIALWFFGKSRSFERIKSIHLQGEN